MYGIETKLAKLAYKIGHVDTSKIQAGDFLQAWSPEEHGNGYIGRLFDLNRTPPSNWEVELYVPSHAAEQIEIHLACAKCLRPPISYSFSKFTNGEICRSSRGNDKCEDCKYQRETLSGKAAEIFRKHASWGKIP